jgi:DNA (cytosine-5)-methyltransferase 1
MKAKLKTLDLFAGIGGFSLGLERTSGFETVAFCEIEPFPVKVLNKHWPDVPVYNDVRELTHERLRADGIFPDIITGGFPCQDISVAGSQKGIGEGTRSGLWSECARLLGEIRPRYAIFENVTALLNGERGDWFKRVLWDISEVGYDAEWHCISASELGAHHHRDRVWIIAYPRHTESQGRDEIKTNHNRCSETGVQKRGEPSSSCCDVAYTKGLRSGGRSNNDSDKRGRVLAQEEQAGGEMGSEAEGFGSKRTKTVANTVSNGLQGGRKGGAIMGSARLRSGAGWDKIKNLCQTKDTWAVEPNVGRVANGVPDRTHRLKSLGNAIVPPIAELIGLAILENERRNDHER